MHRWQGTGRLSEAGVTRVLGGVCTVMGFLLLPDIVKNKIIHFDLLHEDVSLQYFIPALS